MNKDTFNKGNSEPVFSIDDVRSILGGGLSVQKQQMTRVFQRVNAEDKDELFLNYCKWNEETLRKTQSRQAIYPLNASNNPATSLIVHSVQIN